MIALAVFLMVGVSVLAFSESKYAEKLEDKAAINRMADQSRVKASIRHPNRSAKYIQIYHP